MCMHLSEMKPGGTQNTAKIQHHIRCSCCTPELSDRSTGIKNFEEGSISKLVERTTDTCTPDKRREWSATLPST